MSAVYFSEDRDTSSVCGPSWNVEDARGLGGAIFIPFGGAMVVYIRNVFHILFAPDVRAALTPWGKRKRAPRPHLETRKR